MSKKKNNFYAISVGKKTGIFKSWSECKKYVDGFSGAEYKGFPTKEAAEKYLKNKNEKSDNVGYCGELQIYVDGSYDPNTKVYGYGVVIVKDDNIIDELYGASNDKNVAALRNVSGEMIGAMKGILYAMKNNCKTVDLLYDYAGIQKWVDGDWRSKKELTSLYRQYMLKCSENINILFHKVEAHTGVEYNERADELAKMAVDNFVINIGGDIYYG